MNKFMPFTVFRSPFSMRYPLSVHCKHVNCKRKVNSKSLIVNGVGQ